MIGFYSHASDAGWEIERRDYDNKAHLEGNTISSVTQERKDQPPGDKGGLEF